MDAEQIREYVLNKPHVTEGFPFGEDTLVFKVKNKMFLLLALDETPLRFNVKCDPDEAIALREEYPDIVLPGYHMNKKHWNTVILSGKLPVKQVLEMIDNSYLLVAK
ncbi:MAG: MmcQ/YjbR family DNA-binding protein [Ferruginibacter sp.]